MVEKISRYWLLLSIPIIIRMAGIAAGGIQHLKNLQNSLTDTLIQNASGNIRR